MITRSVREVNVERGWKGSYSSTMTPSGNIYAQRRSRQSFQAFGYRKWGAGNGYLSV